MTQIELALGSDGARRQAPKALRPIHYLGSKLRLVDAIGEVLDELDPVRGNTCDLFSGSGVVSSALSAGRHVVAVDIQEYSRVLASALLQPTPIPTEITATITRPINGDELGERLLWASAPLRQAEEEFTREAAQGRPQLLADFMDAGSVMSVTIGGLDAVPFAIRDVYAEAIRRLDEVGLGASPDSLTLRYFGGIYFGFKQAIDLDVILTRISAQEANLRDTLKAAMLSTASELVGTVGKQFAQPLRPRGTDGKIKGAFWTRVASERAADAFSTFRRWVERYHDRAQSGTDGVAVRADYRDFLRRWSQPLAVIYADPPYTRDHYSRYYHVLETLCLRDNPEVSRTNLRGGMEASRGVYRSDRHQSPFSIISQAGAAFDELFRLARPFGASLVLSYSPEATAGTSRPRVMDIDRLAEVARKYYRGVEVRPVSGVTHSKLTKRELHMDAPDAAEVFLVCIP